jgi:predicted small secreted protein
VKITHPHTLIVLALAATLAACGTDRAASSDVAESTPSVTTAPAGVGDSHPCTQVAAPLADIPTSDTEPRMRIPQPPGWEYSAERDNADSIRFTLFRPGPIATEPPHDVVLVSLEPAPDADAQTIFDGLRANLATSLDAKGLPAELATATTTVCGLPAQTVTYTNTGVQPARTVTTLHVVSKVGGDTYLSAVIATSERDDPTYRDDSKTILEGFEMLPAAASTPS